jgi:hypothetical protein
MLPKGQRVAACVPYTKRKHEWIVAEILTYDPASDTYTVKDLFPERRKRVQYEDIPSDKVQVFPSPEGTVFNKGDKVHFSNFSCISFSLHYFDFSVVL